MDWVTILVTVGSSILGGLAGGLCTYLGVKYTIHHDDIKIQREIIEKSKYLKPRFECVKCTNINNCLKLEDKEDLIEVMYLGVEDLEDQGRPYFKYNKNALNLEKLDCFEYELKNTGKTEISEITISTTLSNFSIFDYNERKTIIEEGLLEYGCDFETKYIKPGETITLRVYYLKDKLVGTLLGSPTILIWLWDVNNRIWKQELYAPSNKIMISQLSNFTELRSYTNIEYGLEKAKEQLKTERRK